MKRSSISLIIREMKIIFVRLVIIKKAKDNKCWQGCRENRIILDHYLWEYELVQWLWKIVSVQFSRSVVSSSLQPHGLQHARLPCPSPTPGACSNSCPSSWWCHPTISSSVDSYSSCLQSFPASGSFQMSQFFASGGQTIGVSTSASVFPINIQD